MSARDGSQVLLFVLHLSGDSTEWDAVRRSALFARDRTLRREIRRWWIEPPVRWAAWLMLNPSDAGEARDDPTALRVTRFTERAGYDPVAMASVF